MKWLITVSVFLVLTVLGCGWASAASLNLRATWTANTESDIKEYRLFRTDGTRILVGTIPHPVTTYDFTSTVADQSSGTLTFVLTAVSTDDNESEDSSTISFGYSLLPPPVPQGLKATKQ